MKKQPWVGLVCAGPVSRSGLARIPGLEEQLGWVKSTTIATASRAVNALRSGRAVRDYESLSKSELILVQAPDSMLPLLIEGLAASGISWAAKSIALVHPVKDSAFLSPLERHGATVASFHLLSESPLRFLMEGHPIAVRRLRRLLRRVPASVLEIRRGRKQDYLAGVYAITADFLPLLSSAIERFRRAGMHNAAAGATATSLVDASMKAFFRVGKRLLDEPAREHLVRRRS